MWLRKKRELTDPDQLFLKLRQLESNSMMTKGEKKSLPKYSFYTDILETILKAEQDFGINKRPLLKELRLVLSKDRRFKQKMDKEVRGQILQMFLLFLVVLLLFFQSLKLFPGQSLSTSIFIAAWQMLGPILFKWLVHQRQEAILGPYRNYFHYLYKFYFYLQAKLPHIKNFKRNKSNGDSSK